MKLTNRDLQVIRLINSHKFMTCAQIQIATGMSQAVAYRRLALLVDNGYLMHYRIFLYRPGVYVATSKGTAVSDDDLSPGRVQLATYDHDVQLVDLALSLQIRYNASWMTERQLRHGQGLSGVGISGHIVDGVLSLSDGRKIGIELELTKKSNSRLIKIVRFLSGNTDFNVIWYFCRNRELAINVKWLAPQFRVFIWPDMTEIDTGCNYSVKYERDNDINWFKN